MVEQATHQLGVMYLRGQDEPGMGHVPVLEQCVVGYPGHLCQGFQYPRMNIINIEYIYIFIATGYRYQPDPAFVWVETGLFVIPEPGQGCGLDINPQHCLVGQLLTDSGGRRGVSNVLQSHHASTI